MTTELKPCPFCGGDTKIETGDGPHPTFWLLCRSCAAEGPWAKSESAARGAWNRRADAYRPPFVAESVASGVAAEAIAADDATRETASTRVIEAPAVPERLEWTEWTRALNAAANDPLMDRVLMRLKAAEDALDAAEKERDEARAEVARLADAVALYRSQQAADWARIATLNKERDEARDVVRLHEEDEARVFTLCGVMPEDVRGDPAVAVERLKAERDEARAERLALSTRLRGIEGDLANIWAICHDSSPDDAPADLCASDVRRDVSAMQDKWWAEEARAEKAEAEFAARDAIVGQVRADFAIVMNGIVGAIGLNRAAQEAHDRILAASRASDAANRKQWRTETTWHLEKFEQIRTACSRALGDEAAGKGAVEAATACAAKVVALQAELAAREKADPWRQAVDDALVLWEMVADDNPRASLARLLAIETQVAVDPCVSQAAADLVASRDKTIRGLEDQVKTLREAVGLAAPFLIGFAEHLAKDLDPALFNVGLLTDLRQKIDSALAATAPAATDDAADDAGLLCLQRRGSMLRLLRRRPPQRHRQGEAMIDTNKIREDVGGPRARDPDNETIHALCDEVDALNLVNSERSQALVDAAAALGYPTLAISNETAVLVAKKASKDLADACAERDQLRAEMAEARKTVDALGRQVAALRGAFVAQGERHAKVGRCRSCGKGPHEAVTQQGYCRSCHHNDEHGLLSLLADTAAVASGFYGEAEVREIVHAVRDEITPRMSAASVDAIISDEIARAKKARSA